VLFDNRAARFPGRFGGLALALENLVALPWRRICAAAGNFRAQESVHGCEGVDGHDASPAGDRQWDGYWTARAGPGVSPP
jgi:hypothetical protein